MKNKFKVGDLVFETLLNGEIRLEKLTSKGEYVSTTYASYNKWGVNEQMPISRLLRANIENRQALVTLYGEGCVPKLPLRGSELTKKLLEKQKYVLCWVSGGSDAFARTQVCRVYVVTAVEDDGFTLDDGGFVECAVPVDMNGNEITEVE